MKTYTIKCQRVIDATMTVEAESKQSIRQMSENDLQDLFLDKAMENYDYIKIQTITLART